MKRNKKILTLGLMASMLIPSVQLSVEKVAAAETVGTAASKSVELGNENEKTSFNHPVVVKEFTQLTAAN